MSKYMHEYNKDRCNYCDRIAFFEEDENGNVVEKGELKTCSGCKSVKYCCKEHQALDRPNHKKFCKRFSKLIAEYKRVRDNRPRGAPKPQKPSPYRIHDLVESGDWRGLLLLLSEYPTSDLKEIDKHSPDFMSPLQLACGQGQLECADILIRHGADVNEECSQTRLTPLQYASWWGHDDIVTLLIHNGADVNKKNSNETFPLGYACSKLQPHIVELLLRNGADPMERNFFGWTCLIQTVCMGETPQERNDDKRSDVQKKLEDNPKIIQIAKMLLDAGTDINARAHSEWGKFDFKGDTALNFCSEDRKLDVMKYLISKGADLNIQRECKSKAAHEIIVIFLLFIVSNLIPYHQYICLADGRNALLKAAEYKELKALQLLIDSGADITVNNNDGRDYHQLLRLPNPMDEN